MAKEKNEKVRFYELIAQEAKTTKKAFFNPNLRKEEQFIFTRYWAINCDVREDIRKEIKKAKFNL